MFWDPKNQYPGPTRPSKRSNSNGSRKLSSASPARAILPAQVRRIEGVRGEQIRSADLRRLPFTTGADLRAVYPDGLLAVSRDEPIRLHTSSGTTGKPKAIFFSRHDVNNAAELIARSFG